MARKITKRQQQIYDFIKEYQQEKGYPPSVREMASAVGLSSPSTVHAHLSALEARGLLKRDATKPRALELFDEDGSSVSISKSDEPTAPRGTVSLPLVGRVAAGIPILAEQNIEDTFTIPTEIATDQGSFILEVHGNSMINVGIYNGDYIIVREQKSAMNGEIVVAMIDGSATVKTFYKEQGRVRLQPENDTMEPIYATNPVILGKVVGLMRRFSYCKNASPYLIPSAGLRCYRWQVFTPATIWPTYMDGICHGLPKRFSRISGALVSAGYFCLSPVGCARSRAITLSAPSNTRPQLWSYGLQLH